MRVAALYDVHGNLPALEAVLGEIRRAGVDLVVCGGDVVPGPMAAESLEALAAAAPATRFLAGNGEHDLLALCRGEEISRVPAPFRATLRWTAEQLGDTQLAEIASWPPTVELEVPRLGRVLFCHATPRDDNEIFTRLTPEERLRPVFAATGAALVVCGHTHMQLDRTIGAVRVVNAGSVGMPFGDPGAHWALFGPGVELRRTPYDLEAAATRLAATGCPNPAGYDVRRPPAEAPMLERFEAAALRGDSTRG